MKFKLVLFIFTAVIAKCYSADDGGCGLEGPNLDWQSNLCIFDAISDVDTLNEQFTFTDTLEVTTTDNGTASSYLDIEVDQDNKILLVKTNDNFINFDNDTPTSASTEIIISVTATLKCPKGDSKLTFSIPVEDTNNNKPTFLNPTYEYSMPMPLVPKIDLTNFGDLIIAEDLDFSNKKITFTVDPSDVFQVESVATSDTKQFRTSLKVAQYQRFSEDTVVTITATDEGTPTSSSTTTVTIKVDQELSLPDIPTFKNAVYKFEYSESEGVPAVKALGDPITVTTSDATVTDVTIEDNNYVTAVFDQTTSQVSIDTTGTPIGLTTESVMLFELTVTLNKNPTDSSKTIILLEIPNDNVITVPTFSEPFYTAQYLTESDPHTIKLDEGQEISITEKEDVDITLSGDDHFSINYDTDAGKWQLNVVTNLEEDVLKKGQDIILTLEASVKDSSVSVGKGYTALVVKLPEVKVIEVPSFTQIHYSANYVVNTEEGQADTVTIEDGPITLNPTEEVVNVALDESSGNGNFKVTKEDDHWIITVTTNLAQEDLDKGGEIVLSLSATVTGQDDIQGFATLIIALPPVKQAEVPLFSQVYYTADYAVNTQGELDTVTISNGPIATEPTDALVALVDSSDNFGVALKEDHWIITVTKNLAQEDLAKGGDILLSLSAIVTGQDDNQGFATLVIALPPVAETQVPKFSEAYYTASYKVVEDHGTVELSNGPIAATSAGATVDITLKESSDNFELVLDDGTWVVNVIKDLPQDVLESGAEYVLTLEATVEGGEAVDPGESVLIITVQAPEIPVFGQPHYTAQYTVDSEKGTITITDGPITVTPSDSVTVALEDSEYLDYFSLTIDPETKTCLVAVVQNLPQDVLDKAEDIILNLEATTSGSKAGVSVLVITLPKAATSDIPKFSKAYYIGKYEVDSDQNAKVTLKSPITIASPEDQTVTVNFAEVTEYFDIQENPTTNVWEVSVTKNLPDAVLQSGEDQIFSLQAIIAGGAADDTGTSALVIQIEKTDPVNTPKFLKPYYSATYNVDENGDPSVSVTDGPITLSSSDAVVDVTFADSYAEYFAIDLSADPQITVIKPVEDDVINENQEILLTLQVSLKESTDVETAVVALKLPYVETSKTLKFTQPAYEFSYVLDDDAASIDTHGESISLANGDSSVEITVSGTYKDNFKVQPNGDDTYSISVETPLDQSVLDGQLDILLILDAALAGADDGFATILLDLPKKEAGTSPQFAKSSYTATYSIEDDNDIVTLDDVITLEDATVAATVTVEGTYSDNFNIVPNADDNTYTLEVVSNLDDATLIKEVDIVLSLKASTEGATTFGSATLVIKLPKKVAPAAFTQPYYEADYKLEEKTHSIELKNGPIDLDGDNIAETTVALTGDLKDNFAISATAPYEITLTANLDEDVLNSQHDVVITLVASLEGSSLTSSAPVIITIPDAPSPPKFTQVMYTAKYEVTDDAATVTLEDGTIATDAEDPSSVTVSVESPYDANFDLTYDDATKTYSVKVNTLLDTDVVDKQSEIYVVLDATVDRALDHSSASLVVKMPAKTSDVVPKFSEAYYTATYKHEADADDTVEIPDATSVAIVSDHASDTTVAVVDYYVANFEPTLDGDAWQLVVQQKLDDDILNNQKEIYVTLEASLTGSAEVGRTTIIMSLPTQDLKEAPRFTETYYTAEYTIDSEGTHQVTCDPISITVPADDALTKVTLQDYADNFKLTHDTDKAEWTITLDKNLDDTVLKANTELNIVLSAHLDNSKGDGTATLVVKLPKIAEEAIAFGQDIYEGAYTKSDGDNDDTVELLSEIVVTSGATVAIQTEDYKDNFAVDCQDTKCTLSVAQDLSDDILTTKSEIVLVLEASKTDVTDKGKATVIVSLPLQDVINAPEFEEVVYATTYSLDQNDKGTVTSVQIKIKGVDDVKDIEVKLSGDNEDCFTVAPKTDHWELTVANNLPQTVVDDNISILLTLTATKSGVTVSGEAGLVVNMPQKVAASEFHFETNVYMGDYSTENELSIESDIVIDGVKRDDPKIDLTGDYKDSFSAAYADQKVTITLKSPLSSDVLENNAVISVGIKATQDTDEATATLVVKLPKQQDDSEGPEFTKLTYTATYTIHKDDADEITIDDGPIQIQNVDDPSKLTLTIDDNNKEYLQIEAEEDHWKITVLKNLPLEITDDQASLVVTLTAKLEGVASPGEAALVIHLPKKVAPASFNFDSNSYLASYSLDEDGNYILTVATTITIEGDSEVDVALEGDFSKYFKATRQDSTVTITKADTLPDNIVNTESAISVDIVATKETNVTETVKATLIVKLPKSQRNGGDSDDSSDDKTGLIAAVAVLAVLLVASLVGSAVFYYLKFKRGNNYSNMDEGPRLSERFRKNSNSTDTKKIDHPTRRPTGVIKYPLNDEVVGETTTDDDPFERRKSVQFDVVNIDELEIESEMPDDDPEEIEYESMENEEENSTDL